MDSAAIKAEVTTQPQYASAYAARDVNAIQAIYNAVLTVGKLDMEAIDAYLKSNNVLPDDAQPAYWTIKSMAVGATQPQATLAQMILDLFSSRLPGVDFSLPVVASIFGKCVSAGVLSAQNQTDIVALASSRRSASIDDLAYALYNNDGSVK